MTNNSAANQQIEEVLCLTCKKPMLEVPMHGWDGSEIRPRRFRCISWGKDVYYWNDPVLGGVPFTFPVSEYASRRDAFPGTGVEFLQDIAMLALAGTE
ncbi:MAG: hypothetical protein HY422_01665 [Candidatus Komeilibacteria bacterium]|nr:hypothetical protein [Candidatus Komeilibacteria bacterium]